MVVGIIFLSFLSTPLQYFKYKENPKPIIFKSSEVKKEEDRWFGKDKFWHWAMSFTLVGSSYHLIHCRLGEEKTKATTISISFTLGCGLAKEFYDSRSPRGMFSIKDFVYDLLGIATGYFVFIR